MIQTFTVCETHYFLFRKHLGCSPTKLYKTDTVHVYKFYICSIVVLMQGPGIYTPNVVLWLFWKCRMAYGYLVESGSTDWIYAWLPWVDHSETATSPRAAPIRIHDRLFACMVGCPRWRDGPWLVHSRSLWGFTSPDPDLYAISWVLSKYNNMAKIYWDFLMQSVSFFSFHIPSEICSTIFKSSVTT